MLFSSSIAGLHKNKITNTRFQGVSFQDFAGLQEKKLNHST